ncbi:MAG: hypothetical protein EA339_02875 [Rhodobacteraceae bacterium]|nr:MAG: hypothetical protein EA339_02875 [Paracoccaceae bacterium]
MLRITLTACPAAGPRTAQMGQMQAPGRTLSAQMIASFLSKDVNPVANLQVGLLRSMVIAPLRMNNIMACGLQRVLAESPDCGSCGRARMRRVHAGRYYRTNERIRQTPSCGTCGPHGEIGRKQQCHPPSLNWRPPS